MDFCRNFPFFSIMLAMGSGIVSSVLSGKWARRINLIMLSLVLLLSAGVLYYTCMTGTSFTYMMGHFPAPWGNEIRGGILEGLMALFFSLIMLLSVIGGMGHIRTDIEEGKKNLYYVLLDMMMSSLLALIYTNDLFTGYVFVEINTIAACGMIMIRQNGHAIVSAIRYMIMSLVGSGTFLIGITVLYDITGQLLMVPAREAVEEIMISGQYMIPLRLVIALFAVGLGIKCGLYPFHAWIPETYGYTTPTSSAVLSGLVSKGYIILLVKILTRMIGLDNAANSQVLNILFIFGVAGMIMGSVHAMSQKDVRKMIAYSSVAQIGYIFMGIGLGTEQGMIAALFHILTHGAAKVLLFISVTGLYEVSEGRTDYLSLRGAGFRNKPAGIAFTVGAFSMVGIPFLPGFISKLLFAEAGLGVGTAKMVLTLAALAISTFLNVLYFLRLVVSLYSYNAGNTKQDRQFFPELRTGFGMSNVLACGLLVIVNLFIGMFSEVIVTALQRGFWMFG